MIWRPRVGLSLIILTGIVVGFGSRIAWQWLVAGRTADGPTALFRRIEGWVDHTAVATNGPAVVLLVSGYDVRTCEDLGRQLREFVRREVEPNGLQLTVWFYDDDAAAVETFLEVERLAAGEIVAVSPDGLFGADARQVPTPAVFVVTAEGRYSGIAYESRARLVRDTSFVNLLSVSRALGDGGVSDSTYLR